MKLNKIAALAMAGVMAVSMLAGCSGKGNGNGGDGTVVVDPTSSVVDTVNNNQSVLNKVKITFAADSDLDNALEALVKRNGNNALTGSNIDLTDLEKLIGVEAGDDDDLMTKWSDPDNRGLKKGAVVVNTVVKAERIVAMNDEAAEKILAKEISKYITDRNLTDTTYDKDTTTVKELYYDFDYEGTVSLVSFEGVGGVTYYVGAWTITQTATVQEWSR